MRSPQVFDGFSIGSNDLTQLTLGVDRDSDIVAFDFDERDPGMLEMLRLAVSRRAAQPPPCRHLRRGAGELSGDRPLPRRHRHRFDQRQPIQPAAHDRRGAGGGAIRSGQGRLDMPPRQTSRGGSVDELGCRTRSEGVAQSVRYRRGPVPPTGSALLITATTETILNA